jgi:CO/xanthine dehydrogenase Mo-binding subunit
MDPAAFQGLNPAGPESEFGYKIPNVLIDHAMRNPPIRPGFWRGVNANHNAIYSECFIDEVAHAAGQDPLEFRRGHQDGGMGIVTARMHDAHLLTVPSGARLRREWKIDLLGHRQGIHVAAQQHRGARLAAAQHGGHRAQPAPAADLNGSSLA